MSLAQGTTMFSFGINKVEAQLAIGNDSQREARDQARSPSSLESSGRPTMYIVDDAPVWNKYPADARLYDDELAASLCSRLDSLLIRAGLLSVVSTVFMIAVSKDHTEDLKREVRALVLDFSLRLDHVSFGASSGRSPACTVVLWFMSLIFSLLSAVGVAFAKAWISRYRAKPSLEGLAHTSSSPTVLPRWHIQHVVRFLPALLCISFGLFWGGLVHVFPNKTPLLLSALLLGILFLYGSRAVFIDNHLNLLTQTLSTRLCVIKRFLFRETQESLPGPGGSVHTGPTTATPTGLCLSQYSGTVTETCIQVQTRITLLLRNFACYVSSGFLKGELNAGGEHPPAEAHAGSLIHRTTSCITAAPRLITTRCIGRRADKQDNHFPSNGYCDPLEKIASFTEKNIVVAPTSQIKVRSLTGRIDILTGPLYPGGFSDVYSAQLDNDGGPEKVAMKMLRIFTSEAHMAKAKKKFRREVELWSALRHPHVLPFYGTCELDEYRIFMVSPWAAGGNSLEYLSRHPFADRRKLLLQTASALVYLHSGTHAPPIVHGDLKADNVLISTSGDALLADFGLSIHVEEILAISGSSSAGLAGGNARFMAPELLLAPNDQSGSSRPTRQSDVFSFASLMLQIYTEKVPFAHLRREVQVIMQIATGKLPPRPTDPVVLERGLDNRIWGLMSQCWCFNAQERPTMEDLRTRLMTRGQAIL